MDTEARDLTFGEKAVGLTFNPSNDENVDAIKRSCAAAIDVLNSLRTTLNPDQGDTRNGEVMRMLAKAITELQTAQMWGVKAATWKK